MKKLQALSQYKETESQARKWPSESMTLIQALTSASLGNCRFQPHDIPFQLGFPDPFLKLSSWWMSVGFNFKW